LYDELIQYLSCGGDPSQIFDFNDKEYNSQAKQNSLNRLKLLESLFLDIFSTTNSAESILHSIKPIQWNKEYFSDKLKQLKVELIQLQSKDFLKQQEIRSEHFTEHLNSLRKSSTMEDIESCKRKFENEFGNIGISTSNPNLLSAQINKKPRLIEKK